MTSTADAPHTGAITARSVIAPPAGAPRPQWVPDPRAVAAASITEFGEHMARLHDAPTGGYAELQRWSVENLPEFWQGVWDFFDVQSSADPGPALADSTMPGAVWFPGARLNYVDQVFRHAASSRPAVIGLAEDGGYRELSWPELRRQTGALANQLADLGVGEGDCVAGYIPNIPEAITAFLATASLGATWAACGPDYSAPAAIGRLAQLEPKVLVAADGYRFGGKAHSRVGAVEVLRAAMPSLAAVIMVPQLGEPLPDEAISWDEATCGRAEFTPVQVAFDHPLWVVFSSGTTGRPKGIVHGHGGVMLEQLKALGLQRNLSRDDTLFWYTSTSWMMWNVNLSGLLLGAAVVTYDGNPGYPGQGGLWRLAERVGATCLGTSPGYVLASAKAGVVPKSDCDLSALRSLGVTGSALPASSSLWLAENLPAGVQIGSSSGGTDVASGFVGSAVNVPVWPGELSCAALGVALAAFDAEGNSVVGEVGELVVTKPMPSMPVGFWRDPDGSKYRAAYFDAYPGVWRHGDWIAITERGSITMHGRSDSTLNRNGVRMGSADIYHVVEGLPEIAEALVLGVERPDGGYWMPMFVVPAAGAAFGDAEAERVKAAIRADLSPRHVPDEIIVAPGIPHTRTGKKLEVPLKRLIAGVAASGALDRGSIDDPALVDWFVERYAPKAR
jgi:acetoacetyl-CoA synthetase